MTIANVRAQIVTFQEGAAWIAAWRHYDIVEQGVTEEQAIDRLYLAILATVMSDVADGHTPLASTPKPPKEILTRWESAHRRQHGN